MLTVKINSEITEYREKIFAGMSVRQLACFASATVLAVATSAAAHFWLHLDMQMISYIVMVEVLPFLALGFIRHNGYPFERLFALWWRWFNTNPHIPLRPYKECQYVCKKRKDETAPRECLDAFTLSKAGRKKRKKEALKGVAAAKKAAKQARKSKKGVRSAEEESD